jgi:hypothetical protein
MGDILCTPPKEVRKEKNKREFLEIYIYIYGLKNLIICLHIIK